MKTNNILVRGCKKVCAWFERAEDLFMVVFMMFSGICIMYDIVVRAIGLSGLSWIAEFSRYVYVLTVFIGSSRAMRQGSHMVMDLIHQLLPVKISMIVQLVTHVCLGIFSWILAYNAYNWTLKLKLMKKTWASLPNIPMYWIWIVVTICLVTMGLRAFARAVEYGGKINAHKKQEIQSDVEL